MNMDFTDFTFFGRLVADPEEFRTKNGRTLCKFTVASNRSLGDGKEKTSYIPVLVAGREAELCYKYLTKGRSVLVSGSFETDKYVDNNGVSRTGFTCVVSEFQGYVRFGGSSSRGNNQQD